MAMRMLEAGGLPIVSDGIRAADDSNPKGYFEYERVKELDKTVDKSWLGDARGKAIKIISFLLRDLPDSYNYRVIFMHRQMTELMASQNKMLEARGEPAGAGPGEAVRLAAGYRSHLGEVADLLARRACFTVLYLDHGEVLRNPLDQARRMVKFLRRPLDVTAMAAAVDPTLHRNRG